MTPNATPDASAPSADRVTLETILTSAVTEFFAAYGLPCVPSRVAERLHSDRPPSVSVRGELGSVIALRGRSVSGGLAFVAPVELVARLVPIPATTPSDRQVRDWCSEMANQILGRLKNKLAAYGVDFEVGVPVCFSGRSLRLVFVPDPDGISLAFYAVAQEMCVHLDCTLAPGALARAPGSERPHVATEGDVMLF